MELINRIVKRKSLICSLFLVVLIFFSSCNNGTKQPSLDAKVDHALEVAIEQAGLMADTLFQVPGRLPTTINNQGELVTCDPSWWCSGFFPGVLWYLADYTQDPEIKKNAHQFTMRVEQEKNRTWDHDIGFIIFNSFGNGYRFFKDTAYLPILHTAANSLITRFDSTIGCLRSWDKASWNDQWQYPVIIDNMMNLELLTWASRQFDNPLYKKIAIAHANTTMKNHFRSDYSTFHVVSYDTLTGKPEVKQTSQGYSDGSAWARGQAWGLYGYTMMFRETGIKAYLNQAIHIADFIINHPNLPEDKIPYWDFNAPDIPNALRDASAGAIMCSALLELSGMVPDSLSSIYKETAFVQLETLCDTSYLAKVGENGFFILKHSVGHMPNHSEVDVPLSYGDYYFVESLIRYKSNANNKPYKNE